MPTATNGYPYPVMNPGTSVPGTTFGRPAGMPFPANDPRPTPGSIPGLPRIPMAPSIGKWLGRVNPWVGLALYIWDDINNPQHLEWGEPEPMVIPRPGYDFSQWTTVCDQAGSQDGPWNLNNFCSSGPSFSTTQANWDAREGVGWAAGNWFATFGQDVGQISTTHFFRVNKRIIYVSPLAVPPPALDPYVVPDPNPLSPAAVPEWLPYLVPEVLPPFAPQPRAVPIPRPLATPRARNEPLPYPRGRANPRPRPEPQPHAPALPRRLPPGKGRERKPYGMSGVPRALSNATEVGDVVDCLWNQLNPRLRTQRKRQSGNIGKPKTPGVKDLKTPGRGPAHTESGKAITLQQKIWDLYNNLGDLDRVWPDKEGPMAGIPQSGWTRAGNCMVLNEIGDRAIGAFGRQLGLANQALGARFKTFGPTIGLGRGPTL